MRLKDKVAVVTGGARGIGQAVSELFAKEGAKVVIWDLLDVGSETAQNIIDSGGVAEFSKISVTNRNAVRSDLARINEKYGSIDILINNAGITRDKSLSKMTDEEWDLVIDVNLKGVFICTQEASHYMKSQSYGRIVSASSTTGVFGNFGQTNYAASKAGVIGMTKTWAIELGKYGITCNVIAPGFTLTDMTAAMPPEVIEAGKKLIPMRTVADPIDIAYGYLYLASDEARFVTGVTIAIDGGVTRR
ncbi:MAG: 3-oxoacyl-ACP reductase FabG [Bacteroidia bacterium]|nr:3-oxoacyl-ACP reductase FabG [Bacteroidia bacterium]